MELDAYIWRGYTFQLELILCSCYVKVAKLYSLGRVNQESDCARLSRNMNEILLLSYGYSAHYYAHFLIIHSLKKLSCFDS